MRLLLSLGIGTAQTPFGGISLIGARGEFLGSKNQIFSCRDTPARNYNNFAHFGENLYILARRDWPCKEKFGVTPCRCVLVQKNLMFFLARTHRQGKMLNFFHQDLIPPQTLPNRRGLVVIVKNLNIKDGRQTCKIFLGCTFLTATELRFIFCLLKKWNYNDCVNRPLSVSRLHPVGSFGKTRKNPL